MAAIRNPAMVKALIIAGSGRRTEPRRHQPREHAVSRQAAAQGTPPRATYVPAQRLATVTHGQVGANDQEQRSRRSSARLGDRTSKLVLRVGFPSSAPRLGLAVEILGIMFGGAAFGTKLRPGAVDADRVTFDQTANVKGH